MNVEESAPEKAEPPALDQDKDGIPDDHDKDEVPDPIILPRPVSELTNAKVPVVVRQQAQAIKQHKKVVDKVDDDIQEIQQEMMQKRAVDLENLAKHRRWETKPPLDTDGDRDGCLYKEWKVVRAQKVQSYDAAAGALKMAPEAAAPAAAAPATGGP